jgi:hypothetical protein
VWLLDSLLAGFPASYPAVRYDLFRLVVAVAVGWKLAVEHRSGGWRFFRPDSHVRFRYLVSATGHRLLTERRYRAAYVAKLVALGMLVTGVVPQLAAAVLAAWFLVETRFDLKFHTVYLGLCCAGCALVPTGWWAPPGAVVAEVVQAALAGRPGAAGPVSTLPAVVMVVLTVQMYWSSAYYKLRSPQFRTGLGLDQFSMLMAHARPQLALPEVWYARPLGWLHRRLPEPGRLRLWSAAAWATVALEIVLPVGLLAERTWAAAALVGVGLHAAFAALLPLRLVPFSLATCASYLLMRPP